MLEGERARELEGWRVGGLEGWKRTPLAVLAQLQHVLDKAAPTAFPVTPRKKISYLELNSSFCSRILISSFPEILSGAEGNAVSGLSASRARPWVMGSWYLDGLLSSTLNQTNQKPITKNSRDGPLGVAHLKTRLGPLAAVLKVKLPPRASSRLPRAFGPAQWH